MPCKNYAIKNINICIQSSGIIALKYSMCHVESIMVRGGSFRRGQNRKGHLIALFSPGAHLDPDLNCARGR
jgi:hypothetical protein